jgi:arylsulfatase A-like enzyme
LKEASITIKMRYHGMMRLNYFRRGTDMQLRPLSIIALAIIVLAASNAYRPTAALADSHARPNVILIMTDDQGYGDFGATGNKVLETPHIDALSKRSASMSQFYVSPVCSPTRACLMTGRYNYRTRCIDTFLGRSMMEPDEVTIAEVLSKAGYATGIFGKWHLGDTYPMRAMDQGFTEAITHKGGGLAQPSEPIENGRRYTDAILFRNGKQFKSKGYCTDVYFDGAIDFIAKSQKAKKPFFAYIPTNAPHGPYHDVPEGWRKKYMTKAKELASIMIRPPKNAKGMAQQVDKLARIAAMISNIDENVGKLLAKLDALKLTNNTVVIMMVDNGPNSLRYVADYRGMKTNIHEGGIRSPLWVQWPGKLKAGASSAEPSAHIDMLPTILDMCGVEKPKGLKLDGRSMLPDLRGQRIDRLPRHLVIQTHRGDKPVRYHHFMIRGDRYKLLHASGFGRTGFAGDPKFELYDLLADPGESKNLAAEKPQVLTRLKKAYDVWFDDVGSTRPNNYAPPRIFIGTPHENPTVLTRQDWRGGTSIRHWLLHAPNAGKYDIEFLFDAKPTAGIAELKVGKTTVKVEFKADAKSCKFQNVAIEAGDLKLETVLSHGKNKRGAYHVVVTKK